MGKLALKQFPTQNQIKSKQQKKLTHIISVRSPVPVSSS